MLDYQTALTQLLSHLEKRRTTIIQTPLLNAHGRILAQDTHAQYDAPIFDNSAMDGYAVCLSGNNETFKIIGRIAAGEDAAQFTLTQGQAVRIFTGAPIPKGTDAVIAQELTHVENDQLICQTIPQIGQHIRRQGEDIKLNDVLLHKGHVLTPASIGLAASQGYANLPIYAPIRVQVFSSGNELCEPEQTDLSAGGIFDANRYQLLAWLQQLGCQVIDGGILPDNQALTKNKLLEAAQKNDLILTSGGVSVGEEDHLKTALESIGTLQQWKLLIKPGKPFAWGEIDQASIMMLPGNPVATFVTFKMLVEPSIRLMNGSHLNNARPHSISALADFDLNKADKRREFLRGICQYDKGVAKVSVLKNQGSHMLSACAIANVLIEIPPETTVKKGDLLTIYPLTS